MWVLWACRQLWSHLANTHRDMDIHIQMHAQQAQLNKIRVSCEWAKAGKRERQREREGARYRTEPRAIWWPKGRFWIEWGSSGPIRTRRFRDLSNYGSLWAKKIREQAQQQQKIESVHREEAAKKIKYKSAEQQIKVEYETNGKKATEKAHQNQGKKMSSCRHAADSNSSYSSSNNWKNSFQFLQPPPPPPPPPQHCIFCFVFALCISRLLNFKYKEKKKGFLAQTLRIYWFFL